MPVNKDAREVLIEKALQTLEAKFDPEEYQFTISPRWIPSSLLEADAQQIQSVKLQGGVLRYTKFEVFYKSSGREQRVEIQFKVEAEQKLPVLSHRLQSGEVIEPADVQHQWAVIDLGREKPIQKAEYLVGKTLRRTMRAGQPVLNSHVSSAYAVEAGDTVTLLFSEYGIQIKMACEARQHGAIGEEIQIYCKETRNKYLGKISSPGEATWQKTE